MFAAEILLLCGFAIKDWSEKPDSPAGWERLKQNIIKIKNYITYALRPKPMLFAFPKNLNDQVNPDF